MAQQKYQRWVSIGYVAAAALAHLLFSRIAELVWDLARWPYPEEWPLTPPELVGFVFFVITLVILRRTPVVNVFMNESAAEIAKVTYPEKKETYMTTGVVVLVTAIAAVILAVYDVIWGWFVKLLY
jgi:preprotein translocase subunit SecE